MLRRSIPYFIREKKPPQLKISWGPLEFFYFYELVRGGIRTNEFFCINRSIDFVRLNTFKNALGMSVEIGLVYVTDRNVFFIMKTVYDGLVTGVTPLD